MKGLKLMTNWIEYVFKSDMKDVGPVDELIAVVLILASVLAVYWIGVGVGALLDLILKELERKGWHK